MNQFLYPTRFKSLSMKFLPFTILLFAVLVILGLWQALFISPPDYLQGEMVRIMYVHVPAAWMSLAIYSFIAACSFVNIIWRAKMAFIFAAGSAPIGALFAGVTLITGSVWGSMMWGTWWVWDARLTSMLILFLFYLTYCIIIYADKNILKAEKPASIISIIGFINVPIVKFSVDLWSSLHQPASVLRLEGPAIDFSMLIPLMLMFISNILYFIIILTLRVNIIIGGIKRLN